MKPQQIRVRKFRGRRPEPAIGRGGEPVLGDFMRHADRRGPAGDEEQEN